MADIPGDTGIGLDTRALISGTDVVGVFPSGAFLGSFYMSNTSDIAGGSESWIKGGSLLNYEVVPDDVSKNNPAYKFEYNGDGNVGSITQFIGAGSYVQVLGWSNGSVLDTIGSYF